MEVGREIFKINIYDEGLPMVVLFSLCSISNG